MENFGATLKATTETGFNLDLHGLQLNVTDINAAQKHEQHYGIEHIAVNTSDYPGTLANLRQQGVRILENCHAKSAVASVSWKPRTARRWK